MHLAKIAAVIYLSASLGGFISRDYYRRLSEDMYWNAGLTYMMGLLAVIVGFLIVHYHNLWAKDWTVLITIIVFNPLNGAGKQKSIISTGISAPGVANMGSQLQLTMPL